jgi:O-antigen/teichoic acid export membrane protein
MAAALIRRIGGAGLGARLARGSTWTVLGFGAGQALRLGSNLVLTRLLFPEAFGLMALVTVVLVGLAMLSDVGIGPSIQGHARGDDPAFLRTAWTVQVLRGALLWLVCSALAFPAAAFWGEPALAAMLPVAGLALLVAGFNPTRIETASRHLALGRVTALDLLAQLLSVAAMLVLAVLMRSVWALVWGGVIGALVRLALMWAFLPGPRDRPGWDSAAARDILRFGIWVFLSTLCSFLLTQGDRTILGRYLTLESLGLYAIGFFLAGFPQALAMAVIGRVMIPLYRARPPGASAANFAAVRRARLAVTGGAFALQAVLAFGGMALVGLLYDARFAASGAVTVAVSVALMPALIGLTYDFAALAAGDSRGLFRVNVVRAATQIAFFTAGVELAGLPGALAGQVLAVVLVHPLLIGLARRHGAWDALHDAVFAAAAVAAGAGALWLNRGSLALLQGFG